METLSVLFQTITESFLAIPKILLSLLPLYNALSDFKQILIATAIGIPATALIVVITVIKTIKFLND